MISALLTIFLIGSPSHAETVERTVAIVNTELVLESDFKSLARRLDKQGLVDEALLFGKPISVLKNDRKAQLDYLINEKVIESEIKRLNLSVTLDRADQEIRELAKRNGISETELLKVIKGQGFTEEEFREYQKGKIEKQSLMDSEIISKLRISDEDALHEYLKANPNSKPSIDEFSVAHIFFNPKKGGAEAAYKRAEVALKKLQTGESFETLAEQFSEDSNFTTGGSLGTFKSGEFLSEIEEAISGLKVGETTSIVKSRMGFHIVKVTNKKLAMDPQFEKAKDRVKAQLLEISFKRQLKLWLQTKRDDSFVRINE